MRRRDVILGSVAFAGAGAIALPAGPAKAQTPSVKLVVVGEPTVGKTSLLINYLTGAFPGESIPEVFERYDVNTMVDGAPSTVALWDTAGGREYDTLRPLSYPLTNVFFLCFDVARRETFDAVSARWVSELQTYAAGTPFLLVGTKTDLRDDGTAQVSADEGARMAATIGAAAYRECSALAGLGVDDTFAEAVRAARRA